MVSHRFFIGFAYGSKLAIQEVVTTGLRERQRASVDVERVVEAHSRLREWSFRESDGESSVEVRERKESFSEVQKWEAEIKS